MDEMKIRKNIQIYLPNSITFMSLSSGLISIILSSRGFVVPAAICILLSVFLDSLDGYLARKLKVASSFGKQLDSLVDIVCFGVAPILLVWQYLDIDILSGFWIIPVFVLQIIAGAFRLARFNLQSNKQSSNQETLGLTITQSGMVVTLAVLSDMSIGSNSLSVWKFVLLSLLLSYLMASKLIFQWKKPTKLKLFVYLILGIGLVYVSSPFTMLFVIYLGDLAYSISRHFQLNTVGSKI